MSDPVIYGSDPLASVTGDQGISDVIRTVGYRYCYSGISLTYPDVEDRHVESVTRRFFAATLREGWSVTCICLHRGKIRDTALARKKGYWGNQGKTLPPPNAPSISHTSDYYFVSGSSIRPWMTIPIESYDTTLSLVEHSLKANSMFLVTRERREVDLTPVIEVLEESNEVRHGIVNRSLFIRKVLESGIPEDESFVFSNGGFDYGGIYLNVVSSLGGFEFDECAQ